MPNKFNNKMRPAGGAKTGQRGTDQTNMPMKTANWPGLPGKTQSKDRSNGTKKANVYVKSIGI